MGKLELEKALGGKNHVLLVRIIFIICLISFVLYCFNRNSSISQVFIHITFWGYVLSGTYVGIKLFKYNKLTKSNNVKR